jgi:hypothetical protein
MSIRKSGSCSSPDDPNCPENPEACDARSTLIQVQGQLERMALDLALIRDVLLGGNSPEKGMYVRFDRLEQSHKRSAKLIWLLVGIVITGLGAVIQGKFFN